MLREEVLNLRFEWDPVFLDETIQPLIKSGRADRALMVFVILGRYAGLMVAPVKLSIDYGTSVMTPVASLRDPFLYLGVAAAVAGVVALAVALLRGRWAAAFCLIAAGLTYGMVSNVILIGAILGERLIYLPSAFLLAGAGLLAGASARARWRSRWGCWSWPARRGRSATRPGGTTGSRSTSRAWRSSRGRSGCTSWWPWS